MGARILTAGQRRSRLEATLVLMLEEDFARRGLGRPISQFDARIAAIARVRGCAVVTRNVSDFEHCGVGLINPWR